MYKNLYSNLLRDPEKFKNPHKRIENQIADLILVLSRPHWVDFSLPQNQVVAKFFATASYADQGTYKLFFHQLLLSMELYHRIHSKHFTDHEKQTLISQLPPRISWNLAVARKWKECIKIEKFTADENSKQSKFLPLVGVRIHDSMVSRSSLPTSVGRHRYMSRSYWFT